MIYCLLISIKYYLLILYVPIQTAINIEHKNIAYFKSNFLVLLII